MKKNILFVILSVLLVFSACGTSVNQTKATEPSQTEAPTTTTEAVTTTAPTTDATTTTETETEPETEFVPEPFVYKFYGADFVEGEEIYEYPLNAGMEEWRTITTQERFDSFHIPEEILSNMSTRLLCVEAANIPFIGDCFAFNFLEDYYETMYYRFNVIAELAAREDGADTAYELLVFLGDEAPRGFDQLVLALQGKHLKERPNTVTYPF